MDRRQFLRTSAATAAVASLPGTSSLALAQAAAPATPSSARAPGWRAFEVTTRVEVQKPVGVTRIWLPTPLSSDTAYQRGMGNVWSSETGKVSFGTDPRYQAGMVWAEFGESEPAVLVLTSRFATRDIAVDLAKPGNAPAEDRAVLAKYTAATALLPSDGVVKETSSVIVKGERTDLG